MFSSVFQNGESGIEIFSASGKTPGQGWKVSPTIHRVYDRTVKGFVFLLEKPASASMQIPENIRETLDLTQRYLVIQLRYSPSKAITFEVNTYDIQHQRHRYHISSKFRQIEVKPFHVQIPFLPQCEDNCWINYILDLQELSEQYFHCTYASINSITIQPCCRIRKVFTLPKLDMFPDFHCPSSFDFPSGTPTYTQVIPKWIENVLPTSPIPSPDKTQPSQLPIPQQAEPEITKHEYNEMKSALAVLHKKTTGKSRNVNEMKPPSKTQIDLDQKLLDATLQEISSANPWKVDPPRPKTPSRPAPKSPIRLSEVLNLDQLQPSNISSDNPELTSTAPPRPTTASSPRPTTQQSQLKMASFDIQPSLPSSLPSSSSSSSRPGTQQSQRNSSQMEPLVISRPTTQQSQQSQNNMASFDLPRSPSTSSRPGTQQSQQSQHSTAFFDLPQPPLSISRPGTQQSQHNSDIRPSSTSSSSSPRPVTQQSQSNLKTSELPPSTLSRPSTQQSQHHLDIRPSSSSSLPSPSPSPAFSSSHSSALGNRCSQLCQDLSIEEIDKILSKFQVVLCNLENSFIDEYGEVEYSKHLLEHL